MDHIQEKEWVLNGELQDLRLIVALLNEHRNLYQPATLWEQIEKAAIEQSFSPSSAAQDRGAPPEAHKAEVACIYAFEFSRSQNEFSDFYRQFFAYM